MERYTLTAPESLTKADHAGRIEAYLQAQGIATAGAVVRWDDAGRCRVTVTADADPAKALEAYTPTLTPDEQDRADVLADAQTAIAEIAGKSRGNRSATEKVLLGLAVASREPVLIPSTPEEPVDTGGGRS